MAQKARFFTISPRGMMVGPLPSAPTSSLLLLLHSDLTTPTMWSSSALFASVGKNPPPTAVRSMLQKQASVFTSRCVVCPEPVLAMDRVCFIRKLRSWTVFDPYLRSSGRRPRRWSCCFERRHVAAPCRRLVLRDCARCKLDGANPARSDHRIALI